ncbi:MAG: 2-dehydropantoate 2-reductase N-terminal domain-containing protein, partial [Pseudomonadota bacterium]
MTIYVFGAGAIGLALVTHLANANRSVVLVRTTAEDIDQSPVSIAINDAKSGTYSAQVDTVSLAKIHDIDGIVVIAAKAYANTDIADALAARGCRSPIVILQNGIGVEDPFIDVGFAQVFRCILYSGGQKTDAYQTNFRSIGSSPVGVVKGQQAILDDCIERLNTPQFPFHVETDIQTETWQKATINAVFNTICPLLDTDNGVFFRDHRATELAMRVIGECVAVAKALGIDLDEQRLRQGLLAISEGSEGQLV